MNKNYFRYSRGGMLLESEAQKNHYRMILQPRKSMQIVQDSSTCCYSINQNKYERNLTKRRYQENERLYRALTMIRDGKGIMELMSERAAEQQLKNKKPTLNSQFRKLERKKELKQGNKRIVQKIGSVQPRIGSTGEWDEHFHRVSKQKKQISRATQNVFDIHSLASQNEEFKGLLRSTLDYGSRNKLSKSAGGKNLKISRRKNTKELMTLNDDNKQEQQNSSRRYWHKHHFSDFSQDQVHLASIKQQINQLTSIQE